jgi:phosphogluconate dehydratase
MTRRPPCASASPPARPTARLLRAEMASYHGPGTCTFYGTANTNQMLMEFMGLHLPGASFVNPNTPLRDALTEAGAARALAITAKAPSTPRLRRARRASPIVNGIVGLHATGGSTNLVIHLIAMARASGVILDWEDLSDLSDVTPLMARVYPNGLRDVNHFHAAGGLGYMIGELLEAGLLHPDTRTIAGGGLAALHAGAEAGRRRARHGRPAPARRSNDNILRPVADPFQKTGGLTLLKGNIGDAVIKTSAVKPEKRVVEAPARVFHDQESVKAAFKAGELTGDFVCVVRFQGRESQRHARAALADPAARRADGARPERRAGDRRADVGRLGQGAGGDPPVAGSCRWRGRLPRSVMVT